MAKIIRLNGAGASGSAGSGTTPASLHLSFSGAQGQVGVRYSSSLIAVGGLQPYTFSIIGTLPWGLTIDTSNGQIAGIPTVAGSYNFQAVVQDFATTIATASCDINIALADGSSLPATVTALSGNDVTGSRWKDSPSGALHAVINATISLSSYPAVVTIWTDPGGGRPTAWRAQFVVTSAGQIITLGLKDSNTDIFPPTTGNENWTLIAAVGAYSETDPIPGSAFTSATFVMHAPATWGATAASGAFVDEIIYADGPVGTAIFGWQHLYVTLPLSDPNFAYARLTVQTGQIIGGVFTPGGIHADETNVGDWASDDDHGEGFFRVSGTDQIFNYNPAWWDVPTDGNNVHRMRWYVASRLDGGTGFTQILQHCWSSGVGVSTAGTVDHQDIVVTTAPTTKSDLIFNSGFEDLDENSLPLHWDIAPVTGNGIETTSGFYFTGTHSLRIKLDPNGSGFNTSFSRYFSARPNEAFYFEAYVRFLLSGSRPISLWLEFYDASGASLGDGGSLGAAIVPGSTTSFTQARAAGVAPVGTSKARYVIDYRFTTADPSGNYAYIDNVKAWPQVPTGDGAEPDGFGGVKAKIGAGLKFTSGATQPDLGYTMELDASGQIAIHNLKSLSSLPTLPDSHYPAGAVIRYTVDGALYRTDGLTWTKSTNPADLAAGAIASGVTLNASQVNAGTFNGCQLILNLNGVTTSITNQFDSGLSVFTGLRVLDNSSGSLSDVTSGSVVTREGTGSGKALSGIFTSGAGVGEVQVISSTGSNIRMIADPSLGGYIQVGSFKVLGSRQTGPGNPAFFALSDVQAWCSSLLTALRAHGFVT